MKKPQNKTQLPVIELTDKSQKISTTPTKYNQDEFPFLYIALREPSKEYKEQPAPKNPLYRIIKIK